jgi:hypothetical protein
MSKFRGIMYVGCSFAAALALVGFFYVINR